MEIKARSRSKMDISLTELQFREARAAQLPFSGWIAVIMAISHLQVWVVHKVIVNQHQISCLGRLQNIPFEMSQL